MKKINLAMLSMCFMAFCSQAENISDALKSCGQQQNSLKRLVCYDKIVNNIDKYSGLNDLLNVPAPLPPSNSRIPSSRPVTAVPATSSVPEPVQTEVADGDDFGLEARRIRKNSEDKIYSKVASTKKDPKGKYIITLANGMVWKQTEPSPIRPKVDSEIYVEKGLMGSHYLSREEVNSRMKVKRIK